MNFTNKDMLKVASQAGVGNATRHVEAELGGVDDDGAEVMPSNKVATAVSPAQQELLSAMQEAGVEGDSATELVDEMSAPTETNDGEPISKEVQTVVASTKVRVSMVSELFSKLGGAWEAVKRFFSRKK